MLKILLWNANGLKQNETELLHLLQENQIGIALITETRCKPNSKLYFPGFTGTNRTLAYSDRES